MKIEKSTYGLYTRITVGASQEIITTSEWSQTISRNPDTFDIPEENEEIAQLSFSFGEDVA